MNRWMWVTAAVSTAVVGAVTFATDPPVNLQVSTPGVAQDGHLNISGTANAGVLRAGSVFGNSTVPAGPATGGDFRTASTSGRGVFGYASSVTGATYGGIFQNASSSGRAVYGLATSPSGTTYGVYGKASSPAGYGVYSEGNLRASGIISGNGSGLTGVNASLLNGFAASAFGQLGGLNSWSGSNTFSNAANSFTGNGAGLSAVNASKLGGLAASAFGQLGAVNAWSGVNTFSNASNSFSGNGSGLSDVNATQLGGLAASAFGQVGGSNTWSGANTFSNPANSFAGNGSGLTGISIDLPFAKSGSAATLFQITNTVAGTSIVGRANSGVGVSGVGVYGLVGESTGSNGGGVYGRNSNPDYVGILGYYKAGVLATAPPFPAAMLIGGKPGGGPDRWKMCTTITDGGQSLTYGTGSVLPITYASHIENTPTKGSVGVTDGTTNAPAGMYVQGSTGYVYANVKNFREDNPRKPGTQIVYACIEGPEVAAYLRGTADLHEGRATIVIPDHFQDVAEPTSISVTLTPCSAESKGLAVISKSLDSGIGVAELAGGKGNYRFDYMIMAVRKGHQDFQVIQPKITFSPATGLSAKPNAIADKP